MTIGAINRAKLQSNHHQQQTHLFQYLDPTGAATADAAVNQALMYSISVKAVKHFRPASSSAVSWNHFWTNISWSRKSCLPSKWHGAGCQPSNSVGPLNGTFLHCMWNLLAFKCIHNAYILTQSCLLTYFLIVTRYRQWHLTCFCYAIKSFFFRLEPLF